MKLMLGTTELADVPDNVAEKIIRLFTSPGRLAGAPRIERSPEPTISFVKLEGTTLGHTRHAQECSVVIEIEATKYEFGPPIEESEYNRILER